MCVARRPKTPNLNPAPAPPQPQQTALRIGRIESKQEASRGPRRLGRYDLRVPVNFKIPS